MNYTTRFFRSEYHLYYRFSINEDANLFTIDVRHSCWSQGTEKQYFWMPPKIVLTGQYLELDSEDFAKFLELMDRAKALEKLINDRLTKVGFMTYKEEGFIPFTQDEMEQVYSDNRLKPLDS